MKLNACENFSRESDKGLPDDELFGDVIGCSALLPVVSVRTSKKYEKI